ncbi:DUF4276 family protein [Carboxylicivirga sediminis]|uniref:DUF4276 family protein n=1 Tax=Carboxylicivirga sediminis TaxID=2006564 RepID=A0A941F4G8_9BACT|nr:DUF4276 family protein [Carboxylicivirga sediminis]MBR8536636.1 DUF4276 family protein [Carboxylicivirga sediminis]
MTRITIIGEGQTEQAFCNDVLSPLLIEKNIYPHNAIITKSGGGIVSWAALKKEISNYLKHDPNLIVTTLIDYYGLKKEHGFPKWDEAHTKVDRAERMSILEQGMLEDIDENLRNRFIPYIQLHEFEGLLFSKIEAFDECFEENEFNDYNYLVETTNTDNPENINDGATTAPSKRLKRIIKGYKKPLYGSMIAEEIGLRTIRDKCPRFNKWIEKILALEE